MLPIMRQILMPQGLVKRDLVAWYDFQQGADADVLYDISGNGNHGQLGSAVGADVNDPTWTAQGLSFGGSHYVVLPFSAIIPNYTIIAAVKATDITAPRGVVGTNRVQSYLNIRNRSGEETYSTTYDGGQKSAKIKGTVTDPCMVTNRTVSGFGVTAGYNNTMGVITAVGGGYGQYPTRIGSTAGDTIFMLGDIYNVLIYKAALQDREIRQNYLYLKKRLTSRGVTL